MPIRANYTVSGIVKQKNVLSSLEAALGEANLLDELAKDGNFTLFAPTDSAIARSDLDFIAQLAEPEWMLHLRNLLLFHVIDSGSLLSKNFKNVARISMMNGESNTLTAKETSGIVGVTKYFVDGSLVAETDLIASNGVVHTVESVIFPSFYRRNLMDYLDQTAELSILADLVRRAGLLNVARNDTLTLFAPNNAAFRNLPRGTLEALQDPANINLLRNVLLYHLAEGVLPIVNDVAAGASTAIILSLLGPPLEITITKNDSILNKRTPTNQTNTLARNGIIHIVSGVLRPPAPAPVTATPPTSPSKSPSTAPSTRKDTKPPVLSPTITVTSAPSQKPKTLLDFIVADRSLSLFSSALVSTGLSQTFANDGFLILFAPTNAAFRALPIESLNKLLSLEWDLHLKSLLLFHTAAFGAPRSLKLTDEMTIKMLNSDEVDIDIDTNGGVSLSSRFTPSVVANSVNASAVNGEAYKIDRLLLPNFVNLDVVDLVEESANLQILSDLIRIAELEDFIRDGPLTLLAPINNAFDALSEEEIEFLLDPANVSQLRRLLLYHVIEGLLPASQLKTGTVATTSMGATINVTVTNQVIRLTGNSQVLLKDRLASNGIIHVIEGVLIPPSTFTIVSEPKTEKKRKSVVKIIHHIVQRLPGH